MGKIIIASLAALSLAVSPAYADHGHYRGERHGYRGGDNSAWMGLAIVGALAGLALLANQAPPRHEPPAYSPQPDYPPPASYLAPAPDAPGTWYFCQSSGMYYPNARACPEGWQPVPASPY